MPKEKHILDRRTLYFNDDGTEMSNEQREVYLVEKAEKKRKEEEAHQARLARDRYRNSLDGQIEDLTKEIAEKQKQLTDLKGLKQLFPDGRKYINRWKTERQCAKSANSQVKDYEYRHSCGCCIDAAVQVWPYLETPYGRVFSDPPYFIIGEGNYGQDRINPDLENIRKYNISETVINKILSLVKEDEDCEDYEEED